MDLLMNGLLTVATLFAGGYCWVLSRRVRDLKSLDKGLGGAIVTLTRQIELARTTLEEARAGSTASKEELQHLVVRADAASTQLRLLIASAPSPMPAPTPVVVAAATPAPAATPILEARAPAARPAQPRVTEPPLTAPDAFETNEPAAGEQPEPMARAAAGGIPAPRRGGTLRSLVTRTRVPPSAAEAPVETAEAAVPKPRQLVQIENPLRRFRQDPSEPAVASEDDILAALRSLAGTES